MSQTNPPRPAKEILPTMYDLKSEDPEEPGLADEFHDLQPQLLRETFLAPNYTKEEVFIATDLNVYYDPNHIHWYKRPDWFAVLGVPRLYQGQDLRLNYVIWQEGVAPSVVVELIGLGTEQEDLGQDFREAYRPPTKWEVYERILRVPYYIVFNRYSNKMNAFENTAGRYRSMNVFDNRVWLSEVGLGIGLWKGSYQDINRLWLRWYDNSLEWVVTPREKAEKELEAEREKTKILRAKLADLGVSLEDL